MSRSAASRLAASRLAAAARSQLRATVPPCRSSEEGLVLPNVAAQLSRRVGPPLCFLGELLFPPPGARCFSGLLGARYQQSDRTGEKRQRRKWRAPLSVICEAFCEPACRAAPRQKLPTAARETAARHIRFRRYASAAHLSAKAAGRHPPCPAVGVPVDRPGGAPEVQRISPGALGRGVPVSSWPVARRIDWLYSGIHLQSGFATSADD